MKYTRWCLLLLLFLQVGGIRVHAENAMFSPSAERIASSEQRSVFEYIAGNWPEINKADFEAIVSSLEPRLESGECTPEEYDDLSFAYLRLGEMEKAQQVLRIYKLERLTEDNGWPEENVLEVTQNTYRILSLYALLAGDVEKCHFFSDELKKTKVDSIPSSQNMTDLILEYHCRYFKGSYPLYPHFSGGFAEYLKKDRKVASGKYVTKVLDMGVNHTLNLIRTVGIEHPYFLEALGDLLATYKNDPQYLYLSSYAYLRASMVSESAEASAAFEHKAIFTLEGENLGFRKYNRVRWASSRKAFFAEVDAGAAAKTTVSLSDLTSSDTQGELSLWPDKAPIMTFLNEQLLKEVNRNFRSRPKEKILNPNIDVSEIKSDARYNVYALIVIGILLASIIVIWRKMAVLIRKQEENDALTDAQENR